MSQQPFVMTPAPFMPTSGALVTAPAPSVLAAVVQAAPGMPQSVLPVMHEPVPTAAPVLEAFDADSVETAFARLSAVHQGFLEAQGKAHAAYMALCERTLGADAATFANDDVTGLQEAPTLEPPTSLPVALPATPSPTPAAEAKVIPFPAANPAPGLDPVPAKPPAPKAEAVPSVPPRPAETGDLHEHPSPSPPQGPVFDRAALETLADGAVAAVFGPEFAPVDAYERHVRMPSGKLLFLSRITGIDLPKAALRDRNAKNLEGTVWSEIDLNEDDWFIHERHTPIGLLVELGQTPLITCAWIGADFISQGNRVFHLLGLTLVFHEQGLPAVGEVMAYETRLANYTRQGDLGITAMHYDVFIGGQRRLSGHNLKAGFFTTDELDGATGLLWTPEEDAPAPSLPHDPAPRPSARRSFSAEQVQAWVNGDAYACFGEGFEPAACHNATPRAPGGALALIREVSAFAPEGGPWGRGYLRAEWPLSPDDFWFALHFKNDPVMPGSLMAEAAVQALSFYMAAIGLTVDRDGWRFEPLKGSSMEVLFRGQATPKSKHVTYEVFIKQVLVDREQPVVRAALLASCDGKKMFLCPDMTLTLVVDYPVRALAPYQRDEAPHYVHPKSDARGDPAAMITWSAGPPSQALGQQYAPYDGGRDLPRVPLPPLGLIGTLKRMSCAPTDVAIGASLESQFRFPAEGPYGPWLAVAPVPLHILMELVLQPSAFIGMYGGIVMAANRSIYLRNLDGYDMTIASPVLVSDAPIDLHTTLLDVSKVGSMTVTRYGIKGTQDGTPLVSLETSFGFFERAAILKQVGLAVAPHEQGLLERSHNEVIDLRSDARDPAYRLLPVGKPLYLDRVTGFWPGEGLEGGDRIQGEHTVNPYAWYFGLHFLNDPVQPGSIGVEMLAQLLQAYAVRKGLLPEGADHAVLCPVPGVSMSWKYRGQVVPTNRLVTVALDIRAVREDDDRTVIVADGSLWADRLKIYEVTGLSLGISPRG